MSAADAGTTASPPPPGPQTSQVRGPIVVVTWVVVANILIWAVNERSWLHCWLLGWKRRGPYFLAITNRASGVSVKARPLSYWCWDLIDPEHLVSLHPALFSVKSHSNMHELLANSMHLGGSQPITEPPNALHVHTHTHTHTHTYTHTQIDT